METPFFSTAIFHPGALAVLRVNAMEVQTLLDIGACLSVMSLELVKKLGIEKRIEKEEVPEDLKGVEGSAIDILGRVPIVVQLGKAKKMYWV